MKVIQISGMKGLLGVVFIGCCLAAGFVAFPGLVAMSAWNWIADKYLSVPQINLFQGILLWAIAALIYFIADKKKVVVSFNNASQLSEEELKYLMRKIKHDEIKSRLVERSRQINQEIISRKEDNEKSEKEKVSK